MILQVCPCPASNTTQQLYVSLCFSARRLYPRQDEVQAAKSGSQADVAVPEGGAREVYRLPLRPTGGHAQCESGRTELQGDLVTHRAGLQRVGELRTWVTALLVLAMGYGCVGP